MHSIPPLRYLISRYGTLDALNSAAATPLMFATAAGHVKVMEYLIEQGADLNHKDNRGATALIRLSRSMPENATEARE